MSIENQQKPGALKIAVQVIGFLIGVALLIWCIRQAFSPENQKQLAALKDAPAHRIALLFGMSAMVLLCSGLSFFLSLRPLRKLDFWDVQATNAIATLLGYVPFKAGMLFRILVHNRRDRVPVALIGAWFGAVSIVMLLTIGPLFAASLTVREINAKWVAIALATGLWGYCFVCALAWYFHGTRGMALLRRFADRLGGAWGRKLVREKFVRTAHGGLDILASPRRVAMLVGVRLMDMASQAGRFYLAGTIVGTPIAPDTCVLLASMHFVVGVISPAGMVGTREAAIVGAATMLGLANAPAMAGVALLVLASEAVVNAGCSLLGVLRLGMHRMFVPRQDSPVQPAGNK
ncbi:MAG: lysylphosphatidylglycerol synthase domain-containing protein [Phycisphaerales bacterium]|nr:flippase-like domain-containing protein [Planctomycetota bacterium]